VQVPPSRTRRAVLIAVTVLSMLAAVYLVGGGYLRQRDAALARARDVAVEGPPCIPLTRAEFEARGLKAPKSTLYEGVEFGRQFGHVECNALRYGDGWGARTYPVCQFTSPTALYVRTEKGAWFYAPGRGVPATVFVPDGEARCVLASNYSFRRLAPDAGARDP
jgi:hypothetical protein